jgi:cholesterol oxidase
MPGLKFGESMTGWFSTRVGDRDYQSGWDRGRVDGSRLEADLTITFDDLDELLRNAACPGHLDGTLRAPTLSPYALTVTDGEFRLFEPDPDHVETWNMRYRLRLASDEGRPYRFEGVKVIHDDPGFDAWADMTTLFVRILDDRDVALGAGILRVSAVDLMRELRTLRVLREANPLKRGRYLWRFLRMFAGRLRHTYGLLDEEGRFWGTRVTTREPVEPKLGRRPSLVTWCDGRGRWHDDGRRPGSDAWLQLTRFEGGPKGPVMLAPGFAMAARSFAMTTNNTNLVAYLLDHQYDVWLFDYRSSIELPSARTEFTFDDIAREDWPVAVREVLRRTRSEAKGVQVVGHCAGSVTFLMAMLAGLTGVRSAVCSQFTMHPRTSWFVRTKVRVPIPPLLRAYGVRTVSPDTERTWRNMALDVALAVIPIPRGERCGSALCRWVNLMYGMTHRHAQLNDATHRALVQSFGVGNVRTIEHLALIMRRGLAVDHSGENVYMAHPHRLAIPIHFLAGKQNHLFLPSSTEQTLQWLTTQNSPASLYTSTELRDYAHLDCFVGPHAEDDVFPVILQHLDAHQAPTSGPGSKTA